MKGKDHHDDAAASRQDGDVIPTHATQEEKDELDRFAEATGLNKPPSVLPRPPAISTDEDRLKFPIKLYEDLKIVSRPLDLTTCVYETVKNSNCLSLYVLNAAERTVGCLQSTATNMITYFLNPKFIKDVDRELCSALDFVEAKVPCIKKSPATMTVYVCTGKCALDCVCQTFECGIETASKLIDLLLCKKEVQREIEDINSQVIPTRT